MARGTILIVEDEEDLMELLRYNLNKENYNVLEAYSAEKGLEYVQNEAIDLILLDVMLPGMDGLELCRALKKESKSEKIPIIMLTAKKEESDIVSGLELGAVDYVVKPFSIKILIARIRAVLRQKTEHLEKNEKNEEVIEISNLTLHPGRYEVFVEGELIHLTSTEFRILSVLVSKIGWVFTRTQIVNQVQGTEYPVTERAVDVHMVSLRKKLKNAGNFIETVRGVGYRFKG
jgi:two-component system alkaline phosphatase synthesis response regulator PhoP